jgi:hypothetical protein
MLSNSLILVVSSERTLMPTYPIPRQMTLETKARTNQSNKEVMNSDGTATDITVMNLI